MKNTIIDGQFVSVWDDGIEITTHCKINTKTNEVFDIEVDESSADMVDILVNQFVLISEVSHTVAQKDDGNAEYWYD